MWFNYVADVFYLQFGYYLDACFLFLAAEVQGAIKLVVCFSAGFVQEHHSGGQPLFPAISIRLHRVADGCSVEGSTRKNNWAGLGLVKCVFFTVSLTEFWVVRCRVCFVVEARVHSDAKDGKLILLRILTEEVLTMRSVKCKNIRTPTKCFYHRFWL